MPLSYFALIADYAGSFYYARAFIQTMSSYLLIFVNFNSLKRDSKTGKLWKLAVSHRNYDYFCTNWPKEVSLTRFKTVSGIHMQHNLFCEVFRQIFCEIFRQILKPKKICHKCFFLHFLNIFSIHTSSQFKRRFTLHFILGEMKYFQFGVWSIAYNWLHEVPRNGTYCGCYFIAIISTEMYFINTM